MKDTDCFLQEFGYERFEHAVEIIGGKWKLRIIYMLAFHERLRYGELKRLLSPITHKMLSTQLKELEKDGLIICRFRIVCCGRLEALLFIMDQILLDRNTWTIHI